MNKPKERPILFSTPMVQAILAGRKTQTRREVKFKGPWLDPLPHVEYARDGMPIWFSSPPTDEIRRSDYFDNGYPCPYGKPGDRLWVRETFWHNDSIPGIEGVAYRADGEPPPGVIDKWRPSIFMPRWASRITLEIESVRVERLKDIGEADAIAEGSYLGRCPCLPRRADKTPLDRAFCQTGCHIHGEEFSSLWQRINGTESWNHNPWVWVVGFKRVKP